MELLQLRYFCSAAETENFSETARNYNVPTSNISQSIHRLEDELGTTLFDRSANKLFLNEQGSILYNNVKTALMLIYDAKIKLCDNQKISGTIKILAETNRRIVTKAVERFQQSYSDVVFFINHTVEDSTDKYDLIVSDRILEQKFFSKHLLIVDKLLLAIKKDNPLARNKNISVKALENEKFITLGNKSGLYKLTNEICHCEGFAPNIVIQSDDPDCARKYIEMGLGVSFVPSLSWKGTFSQNVEYRDVCDVKRHTFAYLNTQKYISKATRAFLDLLLDVAKEYSQE
ncbi:MAG: LysR family transcriptional regulator [Oscillospiraceae bacterium]|nr:LysR family transcriptional regulator [Oscillospiraceae bacterium]